MWDAIFPESDRQFYILLLQASKPRKPGEKPYSELSINKLLREIRLLNRKPPDPVDIEIERVRETVFKKILSGDVDSLKANSDENVIIAGHQICVSHCPIYRVWQWEGNVITHDENGNILRNYFLYGSYDENETENENKIENGVRPLSEEEDDEDEGEKEEEEELVHDSRDVDQVSIKGGGPQCSTSEKLSRTELLKRGMNPVSGVTTVTCKGKNNEVYVISNPDVFKFPNSTDCVILGKIDVASSQL